MAKIIRYPLIAKYIFFMDLRALIYDKNVHSFFPYGRLSLKVHMLEKHGAIKKRINQLIKEGEDV